MREHKRLKRNLDDISVTKSPDRALRAMDSTRHETHDDYEPRSKCETDVPESVFWPRMDGCDWSTCILHIVRRPSERLCFCTIILHLFCSNRRTAAMDYAQDFQTTFEHVHTVPQAE